MMVKFIVSEFDVCHKFSDKIRKDFFKQGENVSFTHNIYCGSFTIFLGFCKENNFNIDVFVEKAIDLATKSNLCSHGWKVHCTLVNKGKYMKCSKDDHNCEISITFIVV